MTVATTSGRIAYAGNGVTTAFAVPFEFNASSELAVWVDGVLKTLTTHYTVSGGSGSTGTVTFVTAPAAATVVAIADMPSITQATDYVANDTFPAETHEAALDKLTRLVRYLSWRVDRAAHIADSEPNVDSMELPTPVELNLIGWNADATELTNFDPTTLVGSAATVDWLTDTFSGDGVEVDFTVSRAPGSASNCDVSIDGVTQIAGVNYTLDGTTLTFTTAPPLGTNNIAVRYGSALATGFSGSSNDVQFLQAGTGATTRSVQSKLRETVSVKDFGAVGDGVTNDTAAINLALASGASRIHFPAGTYKITSGITTISTTGLTLSGDGYTTVLDFSTLASGHALTFGDGTTGATHCRLDNMRLLGGGGASGLRLNGGAVAGTTVSRFSNLVISSFATNLTTSNAWLNEFDNVYLSNATGQSASIGAATNNCLFNRVSFVGGTFAFSATNAQGNQFNSCEFANLTHATSAAITTSQSQVVLINPYFENITSSIIASVGINSESAVKSSLIISGGQCNITSPIIYLNTDKGGVRVHDLICNTNDVSFYDTGGSGPATIYTMVHPSDVTTTPGKAGFTGQYDATDEVFYGNKNLPPYANGGGVSFTTKRQWLEMSTSISSRGINIGTNLTIGNKYMVVLSIRATAGNTYLSGVGGNRTIPGVPTTSENWIVQYIPVTASATTISLLMANTSDAVQIKLIAVVKGHKFPRFDIYKRPLAITSTAAPTSDTWSVGDRVQNSAPAVGQPKGWMCTVAGTPGTWVSEGNL